MSGAKAALHYLSLFVASLVLLGVHGFQNMKRFKVTGRRQRDWHRAAHSPDECFDEELSIHAGSRRHFVRNGVASLLAITLTVTTATTPVSAGTATAALEAPSLNPPFPASLFSQQFLTVDDIPKEYFKESRYIYAFVERILDGDTIRVRHVPGYGLFGKTPLPLQTRGIADKTLSIRLYGVDAPEIAKNSKQTSQPYAEEAKEFATDMVYHKMVKVTLLSRDRYGRALASVQTLQRPSLLTWIPGFGPKDLSVELASAGLAELYTGGGAQYNSNRDLLEKKIATAKRQGKGIWSLGEDRVSAAEQKRILRDQKTSTTSANKDTVP